MTIVNSMLNNVAKALAGESFSYPTHFVVGTTEVTSIDSSATALSGEVGTRLAFTKSRVTNTSTFTAIRSGTDVINTTTGDFIKSIGGDKASTGNDLQFGVVTDELQTTDFDIEFAFNITANRR